MIDELTALRLIEERFRASSNSVALGIGDDTSAIKPSPGKLLLATTDSQVENTHFILDLTSPVELGRKSVAVSLSDIGAMGGRPLYFLSTIGLPEHLQGEYLERLLDGFALASKEFGVELVGGNLTSSETLFIDITILGEVEPSRLIKRDGASPGDDIYVSGSLGDAAIGFELLKSGAASPEAAELIGRYANPEPRLKLGRALGEQGLASAMIDLSDGLLLDMERVTQKSSAGAELFLDTLPLSPAYRSTVGNFSPGLYDYALSGGEDYELLFCSSPALEKRINEISLGGKLELKISKIGRIVAQPGVRVFDHAGNEVDVYSKGFVHFPGDK